MQCILNLILLSFFLPGCEDNNAKDTLEFNRLTPEEERVIIGKGTERAFSGKYVDNKEEGVYVCKRCDTPLYLSEDKFESDCGWPSFDDEIPGAVKRIPDADGDRTEIICNACEAHLGHVFLHERFTKKNTRYCVNSISMQFIPSTEKRFEKAYFGSGCFWGTEYYFQKAGGILETNVGYMGGKTQKPTYRKVCEGNTGHVEIIKVVLDNKKTSYEALLKLFFETHDFTQVDGQGPDIGDQYRSVIFYTSEEQKQTAEKYIQILAEKGYKVATTVEPAAPFWIAENYHQHYYEKNKKMPYCHVYRKIF